MLQDDKSWEEKGEFLNSYFKVCERSLVELAEHGVSHDLWLRLSARHWLIWENHPYQLLHCRQLFQRSRVSWKNSVVQRILSVLCKRKWNPYVQLSGSWQASNSQFIVRWSCEFILNHFSQNPHCKNLIPFPRDVQTTDLTIPIGSWQLQRNWNVPAS